MEFFKAIGILFLLSGVSVGFDDNYPIPEWVEEAVRRHNEFRLGFGSPPLRLNQKLCGSSLAYARELARTGNLEHSTLGYGENLFAASGKSVRIYGSTPVDAWYDEIEHYNFETGQPESENNTDDEVGSFTQVVWKGTTEMCISYAASKPDTNDTQTLYVVAHYMPRGNVEGDEHENIKPKTSSPFFYSESDKAPQRKPLSLPIGSDGLPVDEPDDEPDEHSCWVDSKYDALKVTTPVEFIRKTLDLVNAKRSLHHATPFPPVNEKSELCKSAQGLADMLASNVSITVAIYIPNSHCSTLVTKSDLGQFLPPEELVNNIWYAANKQYEFYHHRTSDGSSSDNFVRLIWKGAEQMCVAFAVNNATEEIFYVGVIFEDPMPNFDDFKSRKANVEASSASKLYPGLIGLTLLPLTLKFFF